MIHIWLALRSTDPIVYFDKYFLSRQFITALQTASSFILSDLTQPWVTATMDELLLIAFCLRHSPSLAWRGCRTSLSRSCASSMTFSTRLVLCLPDLLFHAPIKPVHSLVTWNSPCLGPGEMHFSCLHACIASSVTASQTLGTFRRRLKTHLFAVSLT